MIDPARRVCLAGAMVCCGLLVVAATTACAADRETPDYKTNRPGILDEAEFVQKPGVSIPRDVVLRDEQGREVVLGELFGDRPVILNFVYYDCPLLCNQVLDALVRALNVIKFKVGEDFDVVSISINPADTPESATKKKAMVLAQYTAGGAQVRDGWHFLTGEESSVRRVADAVGFRYSYNESTKLFAHPAGILLTTPEGKVSRYIYGLSFPARDLTLALTESSQGKIGSIMEQAQLLCYVYDPESGSYSFAIMSVIQVLGTMTVVLLVGFIALMLRRDRLRRLPVPGSDSLPSGLSSGTPPVVTN